MAVVAGYWPLIFPGRLFFKNDSGGQWGGRLKKKAPLGEHAVPDEPGIRCRNCREVITSAAFAIEVYGGHQHEFMNPEGLFFKIGCFSAAKGCKQVGRSFLEHTWFRGFAWRISLCGNCGDHIGWHYLAVDNQGFFGLILDRLVRD